MSGDRTEALGAEADEAEEAARAVLAGTDSITIP